MPLAEDIRSLRDRVLADLNAAHDYFTESKAAWRLTERQIEAGRKFVIRSAATGTVTTQDELAGKVQPYVAQYLAQSTFQQFIAIFESYYFDLLRLWLLAYPQNLIGRKVDFKEVLEAPDKDAITALVVGRALNDLLYERPTGWFAYLEDRAKLGCPTPDEIERFAEAKATRDVLAHNRGVAGKTYEAKAGRLSRYRDGERVEIPEPYHRATWELLRKIVTNISDAAIAKVL